MKPTHWTPESPHKALQIALASATLLSISAAPSLAAGAMADATPSTNGVYVTILSPNPGTSLSGTSRIEISAYYESTYGVSSIDLFIDGRKMATQRLNSPEGRGEISFIVNANTLRGGSHTIVVRATATDSEVASARTMLNLSSGTGSDYKAPPSEPLAQAAVGSAPATDALAGPSISVSNPAQDSTVSGIVQIKVNATDPSGKSPYVSLFIDHAFKTLRNFPPYAFDWDTTRLPNGYHTIEVLGYNDAQQVGQAAPVRVMVNNPGGRTFERHDLSDFPASAAAKHAATPTAALRAPTKATKLATTKSLKAKGQPLIAHTVDKSIAGIIERADKLASIDGDAAPLGAASVDETLMAPVIENQTPAQASNTAKASAPSIKLSINAVTKPKYTITAPGHPAIARASLLSALSESRATIAPSEDSSEFAPTSAVHVIPSAPALPKAAVSAPKHERAMMTPGRPVIAHASRQSTDAIDRLLAAGQLDESTPAAVAGAGYAKVTPPISVPRVSLRNSPAAHKPLTQIASASIGIDNIPAGHVPTLTHIEAARISAQAAEETQDIADHGVSEPSLTKAVLRNVRGEYQVVYDNRRVELDRPLQDRGSVLFAPLRRIFESQGGQLAWDHVKRQVHAVNQGTDIVVTIGSKKAVVNNQTVRMSGAPYLFNSRTMLPLDFVGVALDAKVSYDAATGHMIIESR